MKSKKLPSQKYSHSCRKDFNHLGKWVSNGNFSPYTHFSQDMKHTISAKWLPTPNCALSHFLNDFLGLIWLSYSLSKWRFSTLLNDHLGLHQLCWLLHLEWSIDFEHILSTRVFLVPVLTSTPNNSPLKYNCPFEVRLQIRHIYLTTSLFRVLDDILHFWIFLWYENMCAFVGISTPHTVMAIRSSTWTTYCEQAFMNKEEHQL